jgi:hypothetical protein
MNRQTTTHMRECSVRLMTRTTLLLALLLGGGLWWYTTKTASGRELNVAVAWLRGNPVDVTWTIDGVSDHTLRARRGRLDIHRRPWAGQATVHAVGLTNAVFRLGCTLRVRETPTSPAVLLDSDGGLITSREVTCSVGR